MADAYSRKRPARLHTRQDVLLAVMIAGLAWVVAATKPAPPAGPPGREKGDRQTGREARPPARALSPTQFPRTVPGSEPMPAVLENTCLKCHGGEHRKAGLDLSTREGLLIGGDSGPAVVPGDAKASLLYQVVARLKEPYMPFNQDKLPEATLRQIETWINQGAPYSRPLQYPGLRQPADSARRAAAAPDAQGIEFFESRIRPLLVEHCYQCHSGKAATVAGDLLLDSPSGMLKGGRSGPALVPGQPDKSLLIKALRHTDPKLQMPPTEKLSAQQIADFETWIKMGAPDARAAAPAAGVGKAGLNFAEARRFWSFQPPRQGPLPAVKNKAWIKSPIDHFILAKLEQKGFNPAQPADKRTLIRRATYDLTGLPPRPEEIEAFLTDRRPDAFALVVDRLLASPRYGERWGRFWLDLARYADTKGYVFTEERRYPYAHTYRDWVIRAFNEDLPYDQFLMQQIAADRLPRGDDPRSLAALGFLTVGRRFLNNLPDIIDDRIDVVTRTTMGLTVSCARCHDHKYDPVPTKDYYSLYGIFANSVEPKELPLLAALQKTADYLAYMEELKLRQEAADQFLKTRYDALSAGLRTPAQMSAYLTAAREAMNLAEDQLSSLAQKRDLNPFMLKRWRDFMNKAGGRETAERYASLLVQSDTAGAARTGAEKDALQSLLAASDAPINVPRKEAEQLFNRADRDRLRELKRKVDELNVSHPGAPPRAMILEDVPNPTDHPVLIRGNPNNRGELVPRRFLALLSGAERDPFTQGSGRRELAQAIASRENPLTARVMVNRVWLHHFGAGLVRTPSDFGMRSEPPTHPELLDYLALRFMGEGWSLKKLHRMIMLSSVYQQSSEDRPKYRALDPENHLLWRMDRRRLDFEALRDSLLAVSGQLDFTMGGRPISLTARPFANRRTVYGFIDRQNLPNLLRAFDFASPDTHSPQRYATTVPQQALFMINSPFVVAQARQLVKYPSVAEAAAPAARVQALYRLLFQRAPSAEEQALALRFIAAGEAPDTDAPRSPPVAWHYGVGEYDAAGQRIRNFRRLSHFTGEAWQGGPQWPSPKTGWAMLNAGGGHPGDDPQHAVVRRWVAPDDGTISISGTLSHKQKEGDGIQARIVSSRSGELASWTVQRMDAETKIEGIPVKPGDTIDFVVDCRRHPTSDAFKWSPVIRLNPPSDAQAKGKERGLEWNAANDFGEDNGQGPAPLSVWERYAQVLLQTNEFVFVD